MQPELRGLQKCKDPYWKNYDVIYMPKKEIQKELEAFDQLPTGKKGYLVQLVSLLQGTMVMYQNWEIGFMEVFSSFGRNDLEPSDDLGTDILMEKFWNMAYVLVDEIAKGKANESLMQALTVFLQSLEKIYADRESLCQQFQAYTEEISYGLERENYSDEFYSLKKESAEERYLSKMKAKDCFSFLFMQNEGIHPYGMLFSEVAAVLKAFLKMYNLHKKAFCEETLVKLLDCLDHFIVDEKEVTSIAGLEKMTLESKNSIPADTKLIQDYMMKVSRQKRIRRYRIIE